MQGEVDLMINLEKAKQQLLGVMTISEEIAKIKK